MKEKYSARPRFPIKESDELIIMLNSITTRELAIGILANSDHILPWRYVKQVRRLLGNSWISVEDKRLITANQFNKRSTKEKKKIYERSKGKKGY